MHTFEYFPMESYPPYGKQRVYFTCYAQDFDLYFTEITQQILKDFDCTVWYCRDEDVQHESYELQLREMQVFVIPITEKFLTTPCRARDVDLPFAIENNIPLLPIIKESGLGEKYKEICGTLHYLDKNDCDLTTISYEQKLQKFLSLVLLDNEELENVKTAFSDRIFLSYRKKDRALANLVMSSIHDFPFCRDIAIWYDEYLLFGEDFNDAIFNAMKKSRLFVFCVTDNVVNEKNYIQTTEYPKAKEFMLPVLPIIADTMNDAQRKKLPKLYDGIPESVVLSEKDGLEKHLRDIFDAEKYSKKENDPVQCFLIGLAYLNGIEVEVNHPRHWQTDCDVFFFFFEIAQCYAQKGVFVQADEYFVKAEDFSADLKASLVAVYKCEWAKCRLYLQDYATAEEMALTGLDILIDVREKLPDEWNALCKVYAEILSATGKKDESVLWLAQML